MMGINCFGKKIIILLKKLFFSEETQVSNRFELLDGFRGILAISVVLQHNTEWSHFWSNSPGEYKMFLHVGSNFGVISFFLLSSFLLTYKMLANLYNLKGGFMNIFKIFLKYLIRRFFRIYVPYFIFCCFLYSGFATSPNLRNPMYNPWFNLITLNYNSGNYHLWTVIHEIKYYSIIPIFSLLAIKLKRFYILFIFTVVISICLMKQLDVWKTDCLLTSTLKFKNSLGIFIYGSLIAVAYYNLENCFDKLKNLSTFKYVIDILSIFYFFYGFKLSSTTVFSNGQGFCGNTYGIYWNFFVPLLLLLQKDSIFGYFINSPIFRICGKYSFGMYLLHMEGLALARAIRSVNFLSQSLLEAYLLVIIIAFFYGMIFYYLIERPLMNFGNILIRSVETTSSINTRFNV